MTALHCAAWAGYKDCAEFLLLRGAYVNAKSKDYGTPLCLATVRGHSKVVQFLLEDHRADVNAPGGLLGSALHAACVAQSSSCESIARRSVVWILLSHGADLRGTRTFSWDFVMECQNTLPCITSLIIHTDVRTPIHVASETNFCDAVEILSTYGQILMPLSNSSTIQYGQRTSLL